MKQVGLYKRVSTPGQVSEGYSLDDQERVCRDYIDRVVGEGKYNLRVFSDEGVSGKRGFAKLGTKLSKTRPGLSLLVEAIDRGELDTVIFYRLDRISRNARVWLAFLHDHIIKHNVDLISVQDNIDTRSPMGRFASTILALAAELFADITAENVRSAMKRRREDGYPTGHVGYGWQSDGGGDGNDRA